MGQDGTEPGAQSLLPASPFSSSFSGRFCVPAGATVSLLSVSDGVSADTVGVGEPHVPDCPVPSAPPRRSRWPQWPRCRLLPHSEDSALCFCSLEDTAVAVSHRAPGVSAAEPPLEQARGATCTELSAEQGLALLSPAGRTHSRLLCTPGPPGWEVRGSGRPGGREGAGGCGGGGGRAPMRKAPAAGRSERSPLTEGSVGRVRPRAPVRGASGKARAVQTLLPTVDKEQGGGLTATEGRRGWGRQRGGLCCPLREDGKGFS